VVHRLDQEGDRRLADVGESLHALVELGVFLVLKVVDPVPDLDGEELGSLLVAVRADLVHLRVGKLSASRTHHEEDGKDDCPRQGLRFHGILHWYCDRYVPIDRGGHSA
jgi:hypothetical protein